MSNSNNEVVELSPTLVADIQRRVVEVLCEQTEADPARVDRATGFHELGDSLDRVESVMKLEDEFEIQIPDDEVEKMRTVGELIDYLVARLTNRESRAPVSTS